MASVGVLAASLAGGTFLAQTSHAAYMLCTTDPTVTFSTGVTATMFAQVQDTPTDIQSVVFVLHGPATAAVTSVAYDQYGSLEHFSYVPDQQNKHYVLSTAVTTLSGKVKFTTYAKTLGNGQSCTSSQQQGSNSGKPVSITFTC